MQLGFDLFRATERAGATAHEVFPSASYRALAEQPRDVAMTVPLGLAHKGPKDLLDAAAAAYTVRRFLRGEGGEVGGGSA